MARAAAAASMFCAPAAAFVPHGSLRTQPAEPLQRMPAEARVDAPAASAPGGRSWGAVAGGGLAAVGLTFAAARASGRCGRGASRVERRVVGICPPLTEKFDPLNLASTEAKMRLTPPATERPVRPAARGPGFTAMRALPKFGQEERMSPAVPFLKYPEVLEGWVGGEKGFDPLGVTDALPVYLVREAELKHGRVCMLATVGWIATDCGWRFPGEVFQSVSTVQAHDAMVKAGIMGPFLATIGVYEIYGGWLCLQGYEGNIKREAGDFFLGKNFLPKDEEQANVMRLKELENGRLAMLAFSGICTQAVLTGKPWPFL